jgi:hypothetical protein
MASELFECAKIKIPEASTGINSNICDGSRSREEVSEI